MPRKSLITYPANNKKQYTIEQDFLNYLYDSELVTCDADEASWVYLPVYWQRHCFNNNYYLGEAGLDGITQYLSDITKDKTKKYFTVCCMDNGPLGTPYRRGNMSDCYIFNGCLGDQEVENDRIINIPLITTEWKAKSRLERKYTASFIGRRGTHPIRDEMFSRLQSRSDVMLKDGYLTDYADVISDSYLSLCPRGNGITSFRFFESMQLGVVPVLISDHDVRPFNDRICWDEISFYVKSAGDLGPLLEIDKSRLLDMGHKARNVYYNYLNYGKWCKYVIEKLYAVDGKPVDRNLDRCTKGARKVFTRLFKRYR
jgi:hypothetical protein